jgi:hypothetical protein
MPGRLTGGTKTGFMDSKRRNIYVSSNGRYYANGPSGRVYAPKARYINANGSVRTIVATNAIPNKIRPARIAMAPNAARARAKERRYVRARAVVPYVPPAPNSNSPNFEPLNAGNVTAAQTLTAMRAPRGTSRFAALVATSQKPGNSRMQALLNQAARGVRSPTSPVINAVALRALYKAPRARAPRARKPRATPAVMNNVALRGLFGGKVYSGKYKTNEERKAARRAAQARYRAKKRAGQ